MMQKLAKIYIFEKSFIFKIASTLGIYAIPFLVAAQDAGQLTTRIDAVTGSLNVVIEVLFALATVIFIWGVIKYIRSSADDAGRKKAQGIMTWGIIGLAVMTVAWGIATILVSYLGLNQQIPIFRRYPGAPAPCLVPPCT